MKIETKKLIKFLKVKLTETSPIAIAYKAIIIKRLRQGEAKVITKVMHPLKESSELRRFAEIVSEYYGLNVIIDEADFNPFNGRADFKILTPSGKVIALFHMSFYKDAKHWSFGGQTFIVSDQLDELSSKARALQEKK